MWMERKFTAGDLPDALLCISNLYEQICQFLRGDDSQVDAIETYRQIIQKVFHEYAKIPYAHGEWFVS
jgi:hypothetical protein